MAPLSHGDYASPTESHQRLADDQSRCSQHPCIFHSSQLRRIESTLLRQPVRKRAEDATEKNAIQTKKRLL